TSVPTPNGRLVTIRAADGDSIAEMEVTGSERILQLAHDWSYILRVRSRWAANSDLRKAMGMRALKDLGAIGISRDKVQRLTTADRIEVELHDWDPGNAEAARLHEAASEVPWEYLLSAGTRCEGRFQALLISRLFRNGMSAVVPHPPESVLFVE